MTTRMATLATAVALSTIAVCPAGGQVVLRVPFAPAPAQVLGTSRVVYELHVANGTRDTITLRRIDVLDADAGTVLLSAAGGALAARIGRVDGARLDSTRTAMGPGSTTVLYLEVTGARALPRALVHRLGYDARSAQGTTAEGGRTALRAGAPLVLSPPLRGGPWTAVYDAAWERGHRRVYYTVGGQARLPGRYAIDWVKLDSTGRYATGNADSVASWFGYGAEVLAVADAVVAATRDGMPEARSVAANGRHTPEEAAGNYVALDLGQGRYAFYEHLKPGSVLVRPGERVRCGQPIGALGFTGSSTGPHLHFHIADGRTPLGAEGLPYALRAFELLGQYASLDGFGRDPWSPAEAGQARRVAELPAPAAVVRFTPGCGAEGRDG
jgi:murein DD-endopeptidase MepM/ murein hydrolase activator NlpD